MVRDLFSAGLCAALLGSPLAAGADEPAAGDGETKPAAQVDAKPAPTTDAKPAPTSGAKADEPTQPPLVSEEAGETPEDRPLPDYDGRGDEPTTAGDVLIWVPRIVLMPVYLVSEYVLRKPLGALITALDHAGIQKLLGEESDFTLFPTVVADFGFRTSIGLYAGLDNVGFEGHQLRARVAFGGLNFVKAKLKDRIVFDGGKQRIGIYGSYRQRADDTFAGIGPNVGYDLRKVGRFTTQIIEGGAQYDWGLDQPTHLVATAAVRDLDYGRKACGGPALVDQIAAGEVVTPPRFNEGYETFRTELRVALDTREQLSDRKPWARLQAFGSADIHLTRPLTASWVNYGVELGGGFELGLPHRRLSLSLATHFADPIGDDPVPFTSLAEIGTERHLRAFTGGALRGRSSAMATAVYRWPVWVALDGFFHLATGNVFGKHLSGIEADRLRLSFGPGISTNAIDEALMIDVGLSFGTETVERGLAFTSTRLSFGISEGF